MSSNTTGIDTSSAVAPQMETRRAVSFAASHAATPRRSLAEPQTPYVMGPHAFAAAAHASMHISRNSSHSHHAAAPGDRAYADLASHDGDDSTSVGASVAPAVTDALDAHKKILPNLDALRAARTANGEVAKLKSAGLREYYERQNELIDFYIEKAEESLAMAKAELRPASRGAGAGSAAATATDAASKSAAAPAAADGAAAAAAGAGAGAEGAVAGASEAIPSSDAIAARAEERAAGRQSLARAIAFAINASFAANIVLLAIKLYAAISSGSLAVIASLIDSVLDLLSGSVVWVSAFLASRRNPYAFPVGKARYEPVAIIIFAAVMGVAALQIISEAAQAIGKGVAAGGGYEAVPLGTYIVLACIVGIKSALLALCYGLRNDSASVGALALDHMADVVTNSGTLIAVSLAGRFNQVWWLDPAAAIAMAVWMVVIWADAAKEQIGLLASQAATPKELSEITYLAMTHHPEVQFVDTVLAYTVGNRLQVEVDIGMPKSMTLIEAHDIGEALQHKVEALDNVERAFIHLDYEYSHSRSSEHTSPYDMI